MKIAILHNSSPGGAARLVEEVARRLTATDDVTVCTWGDEPASHVRGTTLMWCPAPQLHLPIPFHPFGDLARSVLGSRRAVARIDGMGFDVALVLACRWGQAPTGLRRLRTPSVYFAQESRRRSYEAGYRLSGARAGWRRALWWLGRRAYDGLASGLDRRAIGASGTVVTNSGFTAGRLAEAYGVAAAVVELGVDATRFRPSAEVTSPRRSALLVGALDPTKGGALAVRSLALVPTTVRPPLRLVYNRGDEAFGKGLVALGEELGVDVRLRSRVSDPDLVTEYRSAAVLLAMADDEPFGLTVLEASACGTPTVAIAQGGFLRTVEEGVNGLLVQPCAERVAAAVTGILTNAARFDPDEVAAWTRARWGWDRCVSELRGLLVSAARRPPGVPSQGARVPAGAGDRWGR